MRKKEKYMPCGDDGSAEAFFPLICICGQEQKKGLPGQAF